PVEDAFQRHAPFHARERRARTGVNAAAERDVLAHVATVELELVRIVEPSRITVGRTGTHHHRGAGWHVDVAQLRRLAGHPEHAFDRAVHPQAFLDERRDAAAVVAQLLLDVGPVAEDA